MMMLKTLISVRRQPSGLILAVLVAALSACSQPEQTIRIDFAAQLGGQPASCQSVDAAMSDLRFYVSNPVLISTAGEAVGIELDTDSRWQQSDLALLDFENGQGACVNGTPETNTAITGRIPAGDYRGLEFTVGVPFERNHADPLLASAPLDDSSMHWHWRSGYKFLRVGVATLDDGFWAHIGSLACQGRVQAITACDAPNRIAVDLPEFAPDDEVLIDLNAFVRISEQDGLRVGNCSSGPAETSCIPVFAALGLDFGDIQAASGQQVFRAATH